jgi:hypothetical protein
MVMDDMLRMTSQLTICLDHGILKDTEQMTETER